MGAHANARGPAARFEGRRKPFRCPCGCGHFGVTFCPEHGLRLAVIRDEYENGWQRKMASVGNGGRKQARTPKCCRPDCWEPRASGDAYCWEHENEEAE